MTDTYALSCTYDANTVKAAEPRVNDLQAVETLLYLRRTLNPEVGINTESIRRAAEAVMQGAIPPYVGTPPDRITMTWTIGNVYHLCPHITEDAQAEHVLKIVRDQYSKDVGINLAVIRATGNRIYPMAPATDTHRRFSFNRPRS